MTTDVNGTIEGSDTIQPALLGIENRATMMQIVAYRIPVMPTNTTGTTDSSGTSQDTGTIGNRE